jgi:uncharacterized protein
VGWKQEGTRGLGEFVVSVWRAGEGWGRRILKPAYSAAPFSSLPVARLNQRETDVSTQQSKAEEASRLQGTHEDAGRPCDSGPAPQEGAGEPLRLRVPSPLAIDTPLPHAPSPERYREAAGRRGVSTRASGGSAGDGQAVGGVRPALAGGDPGRIHRQPNDWRGGRPEPSAPDDERGVDARGSSGSSRISRGVRFPARNSDRQDGRGGNRDDGAPSTSRRNRHVTPVLREGVWWAGAPIRGALIGMIWLYRVTVGQLLGGQCRFYPSCSSYAEAAIRDHGWIRGLGLAIWRILRCNPFNPGGIDYPPARASRGPHLYDNDIPERYAVVIHGADSEQRSAGQGHVETLRHGGAPARGEPS